MPGTAKTGGAPLDAATLARISKVIELMRPAIQADGGDVEFVEATPDGTVYVRFHGACIGCPSSDITLQLGIERNLRQHVPEVRQVCVRD
ncbi:MAG TPA: NifU family protein [Phycisphaerales bacterium]|nr:NifU family protein [Phycisphaerales bacterium]